MQKPDWPMNRCEQLCIPFDQAPQSENETLIPAIRVTIALATHNHRAHRLHIVETTADN